jgi:hypothetical protein
LKKCTSCAKDLPDTAMHCVFCGAKQAAAAPAPTANAKTVLGYSAADLLKQAGIPQAGAPAPAPQPFQPPAAPQFTPPAPQPFQPPPQQFAPPAPQPFQPPQQFAPPAPQPFQPPQQFAPPAPQPFAPPPAQAGFGGSATAATMFMQNAPQIPVQPAQPMPPSGPAPYQQPQQFQPPAPQPFQPPQPMGGMGGMPAPQPFQPPQPMGGMGGMPAPQPYNPMPVGGPQAAGQPPFLASQTAARMNKPIEPYTDITKLVLLAFGACLVAAFVVPMSFSPLIMMVTSIGDAPGAMKLAPILVGLGGIGGILLSLSPMPGLQRGLFAAALGVVPILCFGTFVMGGFDWHNIVFPAGGILVPTGLVLRDKYPSDNLPRLFIMIGAACIAVPFFVPFRVVDMVLDLIKALVHPSVLIGLLGGFVPLVLSAFALILAMLPGQVKLGAKQLAWAWFLYPPALAVAQMGADGSLVHTLTNGPGGLFAWAGPSMATNAAQIDAAAAAAQSAAAGGADAAAAAAAAASHLSSTFALPLYTGFAAFACFGLATLFGKQLEQGK